MKRLIRESTVPVIETGAGNCHVYIDESAEWEMAKNIALNAKTQRPSVCNTIETLLIHEKWFEEYGKELIQLFQDKNVEIYGDEIVRGKCPNVLIATEEDWATRIFRFDH